MQTLIACFSGVILKQATYVFRSNAEQSRLTALKKQKRKRARHMHFDARFCFYFFRAELGKRVKVLRVRWLSISELYCMREVVPATLPA